VAVEANAYQEAMIQRLRAFSDVPVKGIRTVKDKTSRALALQARFEQGQVFFTRRGECIEDLVEELLVFPEGRHDDLFDAMALAMEEATSGPGYAQLPIFTRDLEPPERGI
jgi:predicted phage terminase large subunit-like protein